MSRYRIHWRARYRNPYGYPNRETYMGSTFKPVYVNPSHTLNIVGGGEFWADIEAPSAADAALIVTTQETTRAQYPQDMAEDFCLKAIEVLSV